MPLKAKKRCKLDPELKLYNREINKRRIGIEHVFGSLKTFKILAAARILKVFKLPNTCSMPILLLLI
ncbi:transposase family protein, partial [Acinetobacter soli]